MKVRFSVFALMLVLSNAYAGTGAQAPNADDRYAGGAADLLGQSKIELNSKPSQAKLRLGATCHTVGGRNLKAEDAGYEQCLREATQPNPSASVDPNKPQAEVGVEYKF
jgi:hypothetical protein